MTGCYCIFFFFNDTATTEIYTYLHTLSLHDALPIFLPITHVRSLSPGRRVARPPPVRRHVGSSRRPLCAAAAKTSPKQKYRPEIIIFNALPYFSRRRRGHWKRQIGRAHV